jgi:hypothetical protein
MSWTNPTPFMKFDTPNSVALKTVGATYHYYPSLISPNYPKEQMTGSAGYLYYAARGVRCQTRAKCSLLVAPLLVDSIGLEPGQAAKALRERAD